jgi:DMSO/TMAO reductase YedYZ molybdopterin-dependent catalytic subunit
MSTRSTEDVGSARRRAAHAGQAGFLAAAIMLAVQLAWRLGWSKDNVVQAFPEFVVAAIARLTPLSIFGAATENYGSLAKKTLFFAVLIGILAVGYQGGRIAGRLSDRVGASFSARLAAGGIVAGALWLIANLVVMPIAYLGIFARESSYTSDILLQMTVTFALYAVAWAIFSAPALEEGRVEMTTSDQVNRRAFLTRAAFDGATLGAVVAAAAAGWRLVNPRTEPVDTTATQQAVDDIVATQRALQGQARTPTAEAEVAVRESASLTSDLSLAQDQDIFALFGELDAQETITPVLTAIPDFYNVSKNLSDPSVDSEGWTLKITGMVDQELELSYDDLVARATTQKITTLCCISNELNGHLISTAQWTGLPLLELLEEAGVQEGAVDLKFHAADDYEDSVSIEIGLDPDNLIVTGMNGETLPEKHGFPARLIIPNIYGMKNVKWLDRIEVVGEDFQGYWQTRGWSDTAVVNIWGRIDHPDRDTDAGQITATGLAFAGARDISRVEFSLDDGESWADAILEPALNPPFTWVRWAFPFDGQPGAYQIRMRATDGEGNVMDEQERSPLPDGATGWPRRTFEPEG